MKSAELVLRLEPIKLPANVRQVYLVGNWLDNWLAAIPLSKVGATTWETRVKMKPGHYEYKFKIDGLPRWIVDVRAPGFADDGRGDFNSRLLIETEQEVIFCLEETDPCFERSATP